MPPSLRFAFTAALTALAIPLLANALPQLEHLGRGVGAIHHPQYRVAIAW